MFAQAIHKASPRRKKTFKAVNCAALSKSLLQSELFGHSKGAFTGANATREGVFESADGGTVFLDEVGECDLETQATLLGFTTRLKSMACRQKGCRLGEKTEIEVDVRIIAATNRDLHEAIAEGTFREDLYYRLATMTVMLPPLRERKSDISRIAEHLLGIINKQFASEAGQIGYTHKKFSASATAFVNQETWPGNVRAL